MSLCHIREPHLLGQCSFEKPWLHKCLRKGENDTGLPDRYIYSIDTGAEFLEPLSPLPRLVRIQVHSLSMLS